MNVQMLNQNILTTKVQEAEQDIIISMNENKNYAILKVVSSPDNDEIPVGSILYVPIKRVTEVSIDEKSFTVVNKSDIIFIK